MVGEGLIGLEKLDESTEHCWENKRGISRDRIKKKLERVIFVFNKQKFRKRDL